MRQVLPLAPEAISNRDGTKKQGCERNAAKRGVHNIRATHPKLKISVTADGLYSNQPFIDELKKARMSFILVACARSQDVVLITLPMLSFVGYQKRIGWLMLFNLAL